MIIITEKKRGHGFVYSAYDCDSEADFIRRIGLLALRSGETITTVDDALAYLDDKYAQFTRIVTKAQFRASPKAWDSKVLQVAERIGWYTPPQSNEE